MVENKNDDNKELRKEKHRLAIYIFVAIFCGFIILSNARDIFATVDDEFWGEGRYPLWNEVDCRSWFDSKNISYTDDYMCLNVKFNEFANGINSTVYRTYYFGFTDNSEFIYDENGYIVLSNSVFVIKRSRQGKTYIDNNGDLRVGNFPAGFVNDYALANISGSVSLRFKEDMSDIYINDEHFTFSDIMYYKCNIGDLVLDSDALHARVTFTPPFVDTITRESVSNGVSSVMNDFTFSVQNQSQHPIQYVMYISEPGYSPSSWYEPGNFRTGGTSTLLFDNNLKFLYICEEDVYLNQGNLFKSVIMSPWHYVGVGEVDTVRINWDMLDLEANHEYEACVYAMYGTGDAVSTIVSQYDNFVLAGNDTKSEHAVDFSSIVQVYHSTFNVSDPAIYNPDSSVGSAIANNNSTDYRGIMSNIRGYYDSTGKFHTSDYNTLSQGIAKVTNDGLVPSASTPGSPFYHGGDFSDSDSDSDYNGVLHRNTDAFRFVGSCLNYFAITDLSDVLRLSVWLAFAVFIIKRVL